MRITPILKIEEAYNRAIELLAEKHNGTQTPRGHEVFRGTWLCAAKHAWVELAKAAVLDHSRQGIRLGEISQEFENASESQCFMEFHSTCFPDVAGNILSILWKASGMIMINEATKILRLKPGRQRNELIQALENELATLEIFWLCAYTNPESN